MQFYDREAELEALRKACSSNHAEMVVISGRRRIGKSRLVEEFLKNVDAARVLVVPKEERQVASDFASALGLPHGHAIASLREALEYFFSRSEKRILYVDEFANLLEVKLSLPYEFQRAWEEYRGKCDKVLILSGSYVRMMDRIFTRQKAPLFSRAGYVLKVAPLSLDTVFQIQRDIGVVDAEEMIRNHCIFGGVPYYYELIERRRGDGDIIRDLFYEAGAPLQEEGENILRQEFGSTYKKYFALMEAIGAGKVTSSELANTLGSTPTTLSKYISSLQKDFRLVDRMVPFGQNPSRSKKGVYAISDPLLTFWFAHVYGKTVPPDEKELNDFISRRFESFCTEFLRKHLRTEGVTRWGRWWGPLRVSPEGTEVREIDLIVETRRSTYVGECKWTRSRVGMRELNHLRESSNALRFRKPITWVLFSRNGFDPSVAGKAQLFDPAGMASEVLDTPRGDPT